MLVSSFRGYQRTSEIRSELASSFGRFALFSRCRTGDRRRPMRKSEVAVHGILGRRRPADASPHSGTVRRRCREGAIVVPSNDRELS